MAYRRYSRADRLRIVAEAERTSVTAASESTGVPRKTLEYWYHDPEFAELRRETRDSLTEGALVAAMLAQSELVRALKAHELTGQPLVAAYGVAVDKAQLLAGMATARTESRDITGTLSDDDLDAAIREAEALARGEGVTPEGGEAQAGEGD